MIERQLNGKTYLMLNMRDWEIWEPKPRTGTLMTNMHTGETFRYGIDRFPAPNIDRHYPAGFEIVEADEVVEEQLNEVPPLATIRFFDEIREFNADEINRLRTTNIPITFAGTTITNNLYHTATNTAGNNNG